MPALRREATSGYSAGKPAGSGLVVPSARTACDREPRRRFPLRVRFAARLWREGHCRGDRCPCRSVQSCFFRVPRHFEFFSLSNAATSPSPEGARGPGARRATARRRWRSVRRLPRMAPRVRESPHLANAAQRANGRGGEKASTRAFELVLSRLATYSPRESDVCAQACTADENAPPLALRNHGPRAFLNGSAFRATAADAGREGAPRELAGQPCVTGEGARPTTRELRCGHGSLRASRDGARRAGQHFTTGAFEFA